MPQEATTTLHDPVFWVAVASCFISLFALLVSVIYNRRSFRPLVTAMVKTHGKAGNNGIPFDLQLKNSGAFPAKGIRISANKPDIESAIDPKASDNSKKIYLTCFDKETIIPLLQNDESTTCSFGACGKEGKCKFWIYGSEIRVTITYRGWFGKKYKTKQSIYIRNSNSFTNKGWE